jgi:hypothetical protein
MYGVHDLGGMDGFGKVEPEQNEPVFHARWEGRVLAMQRSMGYAGASRADHNRFAQEQLPPATYLTASYYQRWLLGMEKCLIDRGYVTAEELTIGHASQQGKPLKRKLTTEVISAGWRAPRSIDNRRHHSASRQGIVFAPHPAATLILSRSIVAMIRSGSTPWFLPAKNCGGSTRTRRSRSRLTRSRLISIQPNTHQSIWPPPKCKAVTCASARLPKGRYSVNLGRHRRHLPECSSLIKKRCHK